jgi:hypothetical protein
MLNGDGGRMKGSNHFISIFLQVFKRKKEERLSNQDCTINRAEILEYG